MKRHVLLGLRTLHGIRSFRLVLATAVTWLACLTSGRGAEATLEILPGSVVLSGPKARQQLIVEQRCGESSIGQQADSLGWTSSDPSVVVIEDGIAIAKGNGRAQITAKCNGQSAKADVIVKRFDEPFEWNFRNHVESVLAKAGCSSGACHGAQAGKKGFKLSLRGYDPIGDYASITRQARGRRIVPPDPGRSLLLTKPTGAVPHGGGLRLEVGSREYQVIAEWIAAGCPAPSEDDPLLERLEILPASAVLEPEKTQQLVVLAHFSDGHREDVTRWAKYTATNQSVAQVDEEGSVRVMGYGEGAITAWYASQVVVATISSPYAQQIPETVFANAPRRNFIDELVLDKLKSLNLPPSPPASDAEFLRRAFIDTIGVLPTVEETRRFFDDDSADKRDRLIEALLKRPEFIDYWAYKWSDLLLVNSEKLKPAAMWAYYHWIRNHVAAGTPWDGVVRQLLTAKGSTLENGAANFFVLHQDPADLAETASQAFLGMSIGCAKCHNHPLEKWTNDQYYAMANLFARVRAKDVPGEGNRLLFAATEGNLVQSLTGEPQPPQPLDGEPIPLEATADRREHLAQWLTSPENPYFSRSITNRVWANFFAVGLVENVDDLRLTNPASNEALLTAAAGYLVEQRFDLKALMRAILQSATYQRSSRALPENQGDDRFYSRYYPRRLMAEVLLDALSQVTAAPTQFPIYPAGWRALQLPDANVNSKFLKTFGRPDRLITCECERTDDPSMVQVLHLSNGDTINQKLESKGNRLDQRIAAGATNEAIIEEACLAALSRYPTENEKRLLLALLTEPGDEDRRVLIEDLFWSILSSREFLFNH
jgi:hypothetical protein